MKLQTNIRDFKLFKSLQFFILKVVLPSIIFLIVIGALFKTKGIPFRHLVIDPNAFKGIPPYIGMISTLGILFWCASSAISLFVAYILFKNDKLKAEKWAKFLFFSGWITMFLFLDDLFQIHEYYYRPFINFIHIDNSRFIANLFESLFFLGYAIIIISYIYKFKMLFKKTNYAILGLSLISFLVSVLVDIVTPESMPLHFFLEEGSKFLGIVIWCCYFLDCCYQQIQKNISNKNYILSD
ncbi:hypothetical protein H6G04_26355 [Calothrix membranacea FACHB-236]|nr:hypothetical protein [Calothrix membranacea FACHB-236]